MELTPLQLDVLSRLRTAVTSASTRQIVYCTEWLGYLPFGMYHWVTVNGEDISLPFEFDKGDLIALEKAGRLTRIDEWKNANDDLETKVFFELTDTA